MIKSDSIFFTALRINQIVLALPTSAPNFACELSSFHVTCVLLHVKLEAPLDNINIGYQASTVRWKRFFKIACGVQGIAINGLKRVISTTTDTQTFWQGL